MKICLINITISNLVVMIPMYTYKQLDTALKYCTLKVQKCSFVLHKNANQSMKIMDMVYCLFSFSLSSR